MIFRLRSLSEKLILTSALIFLLSIALFSALSFGVLTFLSERDTQREASAHLLSAARSYQQEIATRLQALQQAARDSNILSLAQSHTTVSSMRAQQTLAPVYVRYRLNAAKLDVVDVQAHPIGQLEPDQNTLDDNTALVTALVRAVAQGQVLYAIVPLHAASSPAQSPASIVYAVPIRNALNMPVGVLLASQPLDARFIEELIQGTTGQSVMLCLGNQVISSSGAWQAEAPPLSPAQLCNASTPLSALSYSQRILFEARKMRASPQFSGSPQLIAVDSETLGSVNLVSGRSLLILLAIGVLVFACGLILLALITRHFFLRPLRAIQAWVKTFVPADALPASPALPQTTDELGMLTRSLNLLTTSLSVHHSESVAMSKQMEALLSMSDALISTLNLEQLLGEFVSRLGAIMAVKDVALLLYGRDSFSPWAVAHWSDQVSQPQLAAMPVPQRGAVTVHTDPSSDITLTVTTKMAAVPVARLATTSDKRQAVGSAPQKNGAASYGPRRPRIPRPALRDLDMILSRMAVQKQKIVYAEDIAPIYQERGESWAQMALDAGYRFVIAIPILLQDQPIGAFILFDDKPRQVTSHDKFFLTTAAFQATMAIQNALLFAEIKDKNAALERANHLKAQFLATVTHELRTPLHSIISYGSMLVDGFLEGELTTEQEEYIQFMVRRAEDLSRLVDDMLDLSKIEADRLEVKLEPLALRTCLADVIEQLRPLAHNKGLSLTLEVEEELPMALADSYRVRQVAINLVSNALKFTEQGSVAIRCGRLEGYDMLHIAVQDSGIGISPAALGYIFEAFRQADGSTTRRFGGTGLGLTIARKLIELQGGEVAVESIVGLGSIFSFTLPMMPTAKTPLVVQGSAQRTR